MANQLSKFAPHLANITQPLRELLVKQNTWIWGDAQKVAFEKVKQVLSTSPVLALFDPNLETIVAAGRVFVRTGGSHETATDHRIAEASGVRL